MTVLELKELLHNYPDHFRIGYRDQESADFIEIEVLEITSMSFFDEDSEKVVEVS